MNMGAKLLIFIVFVVLPSFYQADVLALDTLIRQKRANCDGRYNAPEGTIESPNYPSIYPSSSYCTWYITVPGNARISLNFISFQLESSSSCQFDYLEVRDGSSSGSDLLAKLCGSTIPVPIESTGNTMTLKFRSDGSGQYRGFKIQFHSVITCGGNLKSDQGDITSPNYPQNYGANERCTWTIAVPHGNQVLLQFRSFQLQMSHSCESDSVVVYDGPDIYSPPLGMFCGVAYRKSIRSSWNYMTVVFTSDATANFRGFSAQYSKVESRNQLVSIARRNIPVLTVVGTILYFVFLAFM